MNQKWKKLTASLTLVWFMAFVSPFGQIISWAENTRIAFSDPSVMVGNEVTVTMKVTSDSALGTAEIMLNYDPSALEFISGTSANGGAGAIKVLGTMESADQKSFSFTLKFKTLKAGDTQISVTDQEIYDMDSQPLNLDQKGSSTVKVTSPATYSKDATLKSLKISPGTLEPEFSAAVENYNASVDGAAIDLVVNAVASNAGANVTLEGGKNLQAGENQVVVKVTAEDGQTVKNYTIHVTKAEGGEAVPSGGGADPSAQPGQATAAIGDTTYSVAASFDEASLPEGFEAQSYNYKGNEVMAGKGLEKDLLLLYLMDADGNGGFYIYNEAGDTWSKFVQINTDSKAIVVVPLDEGVTVPEGFVEESVDFEGSSITVWVVDSEAEPEYYLLYAMNWNGEKNFYRYDRAEKTIQKYFASGVPSGKYTEIAHTYNELVHDYQIQFYILIAVSALALILLAVVILLILKANGKNGPDRREERDLINGRKRSSSREDFYDEPEEAEETRVKRYSREEFDHEAVRLPKEPEKASFEEDDFAIETSLEEIEEELKKKVLDTSEEEDFEFLDLDDRE